MPMLKKEFLLHEIWVCKGIDSGQDLKHSFKQLKMKGCEKFIPKSSLELKSGRPQFQELLSNLKKDDTIVVTKLDRFARSSEDAIHIIRELFEKGVKVHISEYGID